jgi:hypothetical protein
MAQALIVLVLASAVQLLGFAHAGVIQVSGTPSEASAPIPESFVSYSIEFASFPDFAGTYPLPSHLILLISSRKPLYPKHFLK